MRKLYKIICRIEEEVVKYALVTIAVLIFISAVARSIRQPLNWATDISLLLFAWVIFLGADMAMRHGELVKVDLLLNKFPYSYQKGIVIIWNLCIIFFLAVMLYFGIPLAIESYDRIFNTLGISFSWATLSVPVGAFLMIITTCLKIYHTLKSDNK